MDAYVPLDALERGFGASATVTRPWADPIATKVIWLGPASDPDTPIGRDYQVLGARWVVAVRQDQVPALTKGSIIRAARPGESVKDWQVDGFQSPDHQYFYALVIPETGYVAAAV